MAGTGLRTLVQRTRFRLELVLKTRVEDRIWRKEGIAGGRVVEVETKYR